MKEIMGSSAVTNILIVAFMALIGYVFVDHKLMPWHGTVGVEIGKIQTELQNIHDDIGALKRALDVED